jgi:hypothetical protein
MSAAIANSTTAASALPLSPSDRRRADFEEKQRMVFTSLLFPSLGTLPFLFFALLARRLASFCHSQSERALECLQIARRWS